MPTLFSVTLLPVLPAANQGKERKRGERRERKKELATEKLSA
jgi:hypothetical protein